MLLEGKLVDSRYRLIKLITDDSFSATFLADEVFNDRLSRQVNLFIICQEDLKDNWLNNMVILLNTASPFITRFFTVGEWSYSDRNFYYVISEVNQGSSAEYLKQKRKITPEETVQIVASIANALAYLHEKRIVHRDVTPRNIVRVDNTWKLNDFDIAYILKNTTEEIVDELACAPIYAAPEVVQMNLVSPKMDIWALGIVIIELLTGEIPYNSRHKELFELISEGNPDIPDLPSPFDAIAKGCLVKNYKQRWTARDVLKALE
jgi:serine/threonine protein kinase